MTDITDRGYGSTMVREGRSGSLPGRDVVPDIFLQNLLSYPMPVTIGGSNNVTFTLKGSTRPIRLWNGNDIITLDEDLAYTWNNTSNAILDSTGAAATDTDSVLGVWYMYATAYISSDGNGVHTRTYAIKPSQTAPEATAGPFNSGWLGHPGTAKDRFWTYVGFMVCTTAATPAFRAMVKSGFWWKFAPQSFVLITDAWTAPTNATLHIPKLAKYGLEIGGTLETGADGQVFIGSHTASTIYDAELDISEATASNVAQQVLQSPVTFAPNDTASPFYAIAAPAGDFHLNRIKDVV